MQDIFLFEKTGVAENGKSHRAVPRYRCPPAVLRINACGIQLPASLFQTVVEIN